MKVSYVASNFARLLDTGYSPREQAAYVNTKYKTKEKKVHPVNQPLPDGVKPEAAPEVSIELSNFQWGSRLTPERFKGLVIGKDFIMKEEREIWGEMLKQ